MGPCPGGPQLAESLYLKPQIGKSQKVHFSLLWPRQTQTALPIDFPLAMLLPLYVHLYQKTFLERQVGNLEFFSLFPPALESPELHVGTKLSEDSKESLLQIVGHYAEGMF